MIDYLFVIDAHHSTAALIKRLVKMPTVLLLDRSLSMSRPASSAEPEGFTRLRLAVEGLTQLTDHLSQHHSHEYLALMAYSSKCELIIPFTKRHEDVREGLKGEEVYDRGDLRGALETVVDIVVHEWGAFVPCQIIVVTDGLPTLQCLQSTTLTPPVAFHFPVQVHVVVMATREELQVAHHSLDPIRHLCSITGLTEDCIVLPDKVLCKESVSTLFASLAEQHFAPHRCVLKCGHLQSSVALSPSPTSHCSNLDFNFGDQSNAFPKLRGLDGQFPSELVVCGFLNMADVVAPPVLTRHLVLDVDVMEPHGGVPGGEGGGVQEAQAPLQEPSFRVLLHGSLKFQSMVALVKLREDWYSFLYSSSEGKNSKRANLVLAVLHPGTHIPWLGPFSHLGLATAAEQIGGFPVGPPYSLSYQNPSCLIWAGDSTLQSDLNKFLRYMRKLPEKETIFLKEFNKLRVAALTYGSPELIQFMIDLLERERSATLQHKGAALLARAIDFLQTSSDCAEKLSSNTAVPQ